MIVMRRWLVSISALAFGLYHAYLGWVMLLSNKGHEPRLVIAALVIYVVVLVASITMYDNMRLPWYQAWANFLAVIAVPFLMQLQLSEDQKGGYATWYVAAAATLLAVIAVRQHKFLAWLGLATLCFQVLNWGGIGFFANSGLIGAISFVVAGTLLAIGIEGTTKAALAFTEEAKLTAAKTARTSASRIERQSRAQEALRGALPTLRNIVAKSGQLDKDEKFEAVLLEAQLRDEIKAAPIIDALVRDAVQQARRRGVEVSISDEGGLDGCGLVELETIRFKVVESLNATKTGRVVIRAPKGEKWRLTIVVMQPGSDETDVFLKLGARV
jgi:hypothetical protein